MLQNVWGPLNAKGAAAKEKGRRGEGRRKHGTPWQEEKANHILRAFQVSKQKGKNNLKKGKKISPRKRGKNNELSQKGVAKF